jgi:hypothetical protein
MRNVTDKAANCREAVKKNSNIRKAGSTAVSGDGSKRVRKYLKLLTKLTNQIVPTKGKP